MKKRRGLALRTQQEGKDDEEEQVLGREAGQAAGVAIPFGAAPVRVEPHKKPHDERRRRAIESKAHDGHLFPHAPRNVHKVEPPPAVALSC